MRAALGCDSALGSRYVRARARALKRPAFFHKQNRGLFSGSGQPGAYKQAEGTCEIPPSQPVDGCEPERASWHSQRTWFQPQRPPVAPREP